MRSTSRTSTSRRLAAALGALLAIAPICAAAAAEPDIAALRAKAEAGDAEAQNNLGGALIQTEEPAKVEEACTWFRRAATRGHAEAMNNYGAMLEKGMGCPHDAAEGRRLIAEAAAKGSVGANLTLADRYLAGGAGYPKDPAKALAFLEAAAAIPSSNGDYAKWRLAMAHLRGEGTAADSKKAYGILVDASEKGSVHAMLSRAVMLATGEGIEEDDTAARYWYLRAAESGEVGFAHGLRGLGSMLVTGEGGPVDLPRGIAYLQIAAAASDQNASKLLDMWQDRITPKVQREAKRIADAWLKKYLKSD